MNFDALYEPYSSRRSGIRGKLHGLNASGPAPQSISIQALKKAGIENIPKYGFIPVTVPGVPSAWAELSAAFGKLPLTDVLQPAIEYAEQGFPLSPVLGSYWKGAVQNFRKILKGSEFDAYFDTFAPNGKSPDIGEIWASPDHARTLRAIAETNAESFYRGELAEKIDRFSKQYGGYLRT